MSSFAKISIRFAADLKGFSTEMANAQKKMTAVGKQMQKVGAGLTVGLTAPVVALGVKATNTFADFEQALAKVEAVSGATGTEMVGLRKNAEDLGASTRFAASEVAGLQLNLSKLGFKPQEILAATDGILSLALATGEDLGNSATVAASTIRGFGLEISETQRVVDVMASSFSSSALDLEKFSTAMAVVAPVANVAGQSIEDTTGFLSVLVNAGIDASTAGTGLRNIFLDIAQKGITLDDALNKINTSTNKNATSLSLFGKRGATVATVLATNIGAARDFTTVYNGAAGSAKRMADIMDNTLTGSFFKVRSAVESAMIALGEEMAPTIRGLADSVAELVSKFKDLDSGTKKMVVVVGALLAAVGPLLVALGLLMTTVIPGLITAFTALNVVVLANPWTALAVALGLAVGAMALFSKETKEAATTQSLLKQVAQEATASIAKEKAEVEKLLFVARDEKVTKEQRLKAILELNKISPKYLGNLNLETINTDKARIAIEQYNDALISTAKAKAAQAKLQEIQAKIIDKELELSARRKAVIDADADAFKGAADNASAAAAAERSLNLAKTLNTLETENGTKALQEQADALINIINLNGGLTTGGTVPPPVVTPELDIDETTELGKFKALGIKAQKDLDELNMMVALDIDTALDEAAVGSYDSKLQGLFDTFLQLDDLPNPFTQLEENAQAFNENLTSIIDSTVTNFASGFGELLATTMQGGSFLQGAFNLVLNTIADLAIQVGNMAVGIGVAVIGIKKALQSLSGPVAIAAGIALIALGTFAKSALSNLGSGGGGGIQVPALASGGIAYSPTLAYVGEYSGANSNPEVIAPLDKLKALIVDAIPGGSSKPVQVFGVLKGLDIHLQNKRTEEYLNRSGK